MITAKIIENFGFIPWSEEDYTSQDHDYSDDENGGIRKEKRFLKWECNRSQSILAKDRDNWVLTFHIKEDRYSLTRVLGGEKTVILNKLKIKKPTVFLILLEVVDFFIEDKN